MIKKSLLAVSVAASLAVVSAPSFAGYLCGTDSLAGNVNVSGFAPVNDQNPLIPSAAGTKTFNIKLMDLQGKVECEIPPPGYYGVDVSGSVKVNYDADPAWDIEKTVLNPTNIFSGLLNTGLTPGPRSYDFDNTGGAGFGALINAGIDFDIDYDGATSASVIALLNTMLGTSFVVPTGAGHLKVTGSRYADGFDLNFVESALSGWDGFGALMLGADMHFDPTAYILTGAAMGLKNPTGLGSYNSATGNFLIENARIHVPEPASLALLGLGLAGLAVTRRRRAA